MSSPPDPIPSVEIAPSYTRRRAALKGRALMAASIIISEGANFETLDAECYELGLAEETLDLVLAEVADELRRRACRLPTKAEVMGHA